MKLIQGRVGFSSGQIETWPLIQGYAIDLFGLGFFSASHQPVDISAYLEQIISQLDIATLYPTVSQYVPYQQKVFTDLVKFISTRNNQSIRKDITEEELKEIMMFPFEYACLQHRKQFLTEPYAKLQGGEEKVIGSSSHLCIQSVCGYSGIVCGRSWFFHPPNQTRELFQQNSSSEKYGLMELYKLILTSSRKSIQSLIDHSEEEVCQMLMFQICKSPALIQNRQILDAVRYNTKVSFNSIDSNGNSCRFDISSYYLHSITVQVLDIKVNGYLNFLIYADSFYVKDQKFTIITKNIDDLVVWEIESGKEQPDTIGQKLNTIENTHLFVPGYAVSQGSLMIYSNGWAFQSPNFGTLSFSLDQFNSIQQNSIDVVTFFTPNNQYTLSLPSRSSAFLTSLWNFSYSSTQEFVFPTKTPIQLFDPVVEQPENHEKKSVYLVTGMPGSGKSKLGNQIARTIKATLITPGLQQACELNKEYYWEKLQQADGSVVLVLPAFCMPLDIVEIIPPSHYIRSVITKVYGGVIFQDTQKFLPGLLQYIKIANFLVYQSGKDDISKLISLVNPDLEIIKTKGVLGPQQARRIIEAYPHLQYEVPFKSILPLQTLFLQVDIPIVQNKLRQKIQNLQTFDEGTLAQRLIRDRSMQIVLVKGGLNFKGKQGTYKMTASCKDFYTVKGSSTSLGLLVIGRNLNKTTLIDTVLASRSHSKKLPLRLRETITPEQVQYVLENMEPNDDYVFDGTYYIDPEGRKTFEHPDLETYVCMYLEEENDRIGDFNRKLQKEAAVFRKINEDKIIKNIFQLIKRIQNQFFYC